VAFDHLVQLLGRIPKKLDNDEEFYALTKVLGDLTETERISQEFNAASRETDPSVPLFELYKRIITLFVERPHSVAASWQIQLCQSKGSDKAIIAMLKHRFDDKKEQAMHERIIWQVLISHFGTSWTRTPFTANAFDILGNLIEKIPRRHGLPEISLRQEMLQALAYFNGDASSQLLLSRFIALAKKNKEEYLQLTVILMTTLSTNIKDLSEDDLYDYVMLILSAYKSFPAQTWYTAALEALPQQLSIVPGPAKLSNIVKHLVSGKLINEASPGKKETEYLWDILPAVVQVILKWSHMSPPECDSAFIDFFLEMGMFACTESFWWEPATVIVSLASNRTNEISVDAASLWALEFLTKDISTISSDICQDIIDTNQAAKTVAFDQYRHAMAQSLFDACYDTRSSKIYESMVPVYTILFSSTDGTNKRNALKKTVVGVISPTEDTAASKDTRGGKKTRPFLYQPSPDTPPEFSLFF